MLRSQTFILGFLGILGFFGFLPHAFAYPEITLRYQHHIYKVDPDVYASWHAPKERWTYEGTEVVPPAALRINGDRLPPLPQGLIRSFEPSWNIPAIVETLQQKIAPKVDRPAEDVTIKRNASGAVVFEGVGMIGRTLDTEASAKLIAAAIERGIQDVELVIREELPTVTVEDPVLQREGIKEIVTIGESSYAGSPLPRRHNISVGLSKFNGHIIPKGAVFSFNEVLGPVDGSTGYWKELVIMGEHTLPEYGGGLCQVSTTAYRGIWEYGFPIVNRRNHSFAVSYYSPQGTDATIYPPNTDMKFLNDGPGALLIQTHQVGDRAYFIYYGTRDDRKTEVVGPYTWDFRTPPPDRTDYTTDIPVGTSRKAGERHPGLKAQWFRIVRASDDAEEKIESVFSAYEARPFITQVGVASLTEKPLAPPSWLGPEWDEETNIP